MTTPCREQGFLTEHAKAHGRAREGHFALGYTPPVIRDDSLWSLSVRTWWDDYFRRRREPNHQWTFMDVADGNSSIPVATFWDNGGFDEGMERRHDWEFGARLLKRGVRLAHYHGAKARHHFETSFRAAVRNARDQGRADVLFAQRHPELVARLPLADVGGLVGAGMSRRRALAYRYPRASEGLAEHAYRALDLLERLGMRSQWQRLMTMALAHSYLLGLVDRFPDPHQFHAFAADVFRRQTVAVVPTWLDRATALGGAHRDRRIDRARTRMGGHAGRRASLRSSQARSGTGKPSPNACCQRPLRRFEGPQSTRRTDCRRCPARPVLRSAASDRGGANARTAGACQGDGEADVVR